MNSYAERARSAGRPAVGRVARSETGHSGWCRRSRRGTLFDIYESRGVKGETRELFGWFVGLLRGASPRPFRLRRRIGLTLSWADATVKAEGAAPFCRA
jgi:hypothetical protein